MKERKTYVDFNLYVEPSAQFGNRKVYRKISLELDENFAPLALELLKHLKHITYVRLSHTRVYKRELIQGFPTGLLDKLCEDFEGCTVYANNGASWYIPKRGELVKDYYADGVYISHRITYNPYIQNSYSALYSNEYENARIITERNEYITTPLKTVKASKAESEWFNRQTERIGLYYNAEKNQYLFK